MSVIAAALLALVAMLHVGTGSQLPDGASYRAGYKAASNDEFVRSVMSMPRR